MKNILQKSSKMTINMNKVYFQIFKRKLIPRYNLIHVTEETGSCGKRLTCTWEVICSNVGLDTNCNH
jgi:hypothetical protein